VEAAHAQNLLHRDLKSNNVLLTKDREGNTRAVVTDFSLAKESAGQDASGSGVVGTAAYMAPELWSGARATVASDIFALGIVLHELVTGRRPDHNPGGGRVMAPAAPRRWRRVIARCVDLDPDRRYKSAAAIAGALSAARVRRRAVAWTAAAVVPLAFVVWPIVFPPPIAARLAILPLEAGDGDPQTTALVRGASSDLSARLTRLRPQPPQLVVIPVEETRGVPADDIGQAKDRLGATHVLRATVAKQGDRLHMRGSIVDTATNVTFAERSADYPAGDPGAVTSALSALVASAFRLPRQNAAEAIAPAAYSAYAEGVAALQNGTASYAPAIAAFERAIVLDPQSVLPRARFVEACHNAWVATADARWLARGQDALTQAERLNGDSMAVRLAAGRLNLVPGRYDRAVGEYRRATQLEPASAEAWSGLARAYMEMHDHDVEAAAAFMKAIELQPGYYLPLIHFGDFYRRLGNYADAEKQWRRVVDVAPQLFAGHANLGGLYSDMGRYADAERELTRALEIDPTSRNGMNNLGALYQYMGRDADAIALFERARAVGPENHILLLNLGDSYRRAGRDADAAAAYRQARNLAEPALLANPRDAALRAFVAYYALRLGDRATAERELTQALNSGGDNRTVVRRAVICYEALGDRNRALGVLQSAQPDVLRELSRQPDLGSLRTDPRFIALLPKSGSG